VEKAVTVASNDPSGPFQTLKVRAEVKPDLHQMSALDMSKSIFSKECQPCHVEKGIGKMGVELYQADCAMCHGSLDVRDHKRALNGPVLAKDMSDLRKTIALGNGRGTMPGFSAAAGGPLSEEQVDSIVDLFKKWQKTERKKHGTR
jgi:mono/diheme cytochrome c family protein